MVDMISGNFIVNKFYQNSVQLLKPLYIDTDGFAFALNPKERRLKRIIDIALGEILEGKRAEVAKRWNGGGLSIGASRVDLTSEQWEWLGKREKIQIAVNSGVPPLSFLDVTGTMHGCGRRSAAGHSGEAGGGDRGGSGQTPEQMTQLLDGGQVDAGVLSPSAERRNRYLFSRAFWSSILCHMWWGCGIERHLRRPC